MRAAVKAAVSGDLKPAQAEPARLAAEHRPGAQPPGLAHAQRGRRRKRRTTHYPAPYALIDLWVDARRRPRRDAEGRRSQSFAKLLVTDTAQNLVRVFFLRENLKSLADGKWDGRRVHVIGAGAMGGDIAAWCAWHGFIVSLADTKPEPIAGAIKRAADLYGKIGRDNRRQGPRLARSPDPRSQGRRRRHRRSDHRGGAGSSRPQAEDLRRHRAEDEARRDPRHQHVEHPARAVARRPAAAGAAGRHPFLQSGVAHAACRGRQPRPGRRRCARRCPRLPRPHRSAAGAGQERAGLPGQPRADALSARSPGHARRRHEEGNHRQGRGGLRHADGADRAGRRGRARHLPACRRDAARQPQPRDARPAAMAQGQGRQGRARQEDRQGPLRLEGRPRGQGAGRDRQPAAGHDRPPDPADARRLRDVPARGHRGRRRHRRRRDDLRHRLRAVPRRPDALCAARAASPTCATRSSASPRNTARASSPIRAGTACNDPLGRRPGQFDDAARLADAIVEKVGKTIVLALAARPRQGQPHRQCAVRQGRGRSARSG